MIIWCILYYKIYYIIYCIPNAKILLKQIEKNKGPNELFGETPKYGFLELMILFRMEMLRAVCYVLSETSDNRRVEHRI
jgi:hypothetical protein